MLYSFADQSHYTIWRRTFLPLYIIHIQSLKQLPREKRRWGEKLSFYIYLTNKHILPTNLSTILMPELSGFAEFELSQGYEKPHSRQYREQGKYQRAGLLASSVQSIYVQTREAVLSWVMKQFQAVNSFQTLQPLSFLCVHPAQKFAQHYC